MSLVQVADSAPAYSELYRACHGYARPAAAVTAQVALLHALGTGLAVMGAALGPEAGKAVNASVLRELFRLLATDATAGAPPTA